MTSEAWPAEDQQERPKQYSKTKSYMEQSTVLGRLPVLRVAIWRAAAVAVRKCVVRPVADV